MTLVDETGKPAQDAPKDEEQKPLIVVFRDKAKGSLVVLTELSPYESLAVANELKDTLFLNIAGNAITAKLKRDAEKLARPTAGDIAAIKGFRR